MILVVTQAKHIPIFGLSESFLESVNYKESVRIGGIFTEAPHISMCVGVLYYGIQLLGMIVKTVVKIVT